MGILDDAEEKPQARKGVSAKLPPALIARIDAIATARALSRNRVIEKLLGHALDIAEKEEAKKKR